MQNKNFYYFKILLIALLSTITMNSFSQLPNVLICGAESDPSYIVDVKAKLEGTGQFASVTTFNIASLTPTLAQLKNYEAILLYVNSPAANSDLMGDNIAAYIDGGGGVVSAVFQTGGFFPVLGEFSKQRYQVIIHGRSVTGTQTLGTIWRSDHPIMNGVSSFNGGTSSYRPTSTTLAPGGYRIADWSDGKFLITAKEDVGPSHVSRVDLGFWPPSSDVRSDLWLSSTDGDLIMANSLTYVAFNPNKCAAPANLQVPRVSDTAALLSWVQPPVPASSFKIQYRPVGSDECFKRWAEGSRHNIIINGLAPNTTYEWRMRSNCLNDTSGWKSGPNFTTTSSVSLTSKTNDIKSSKASMQIMPNPNRGNFTVQMSLPTKEASTTFTLYNNLGGKVWQEYEGKLSGSISKTINLSDKLSTGVYVLMIEYGDVQLREKVVVVK